MSDTFLMGSYSNGQKHRRERHKATWCFLHETDTVTLAAVMRTKGATGSAGLYEEVKKVLQKSG
jgi:hypothetical protein